MLLFPPQNRRADDNDGDSCFLFDSRDKMQHKRHFNSGRDTSMSIATGFIGIDGIVLATDSKLSVTDREGGIESFEGYSKKLWNITDKIGCTSIGTQEGYRKWLISEMSAKSKSISSTENFSELYKGYTNLIQQDILSRILPWGESIAKTLVNRFGLMMLIGGYDESKPRIIDIEMPSVGGLPLVPDEVQGYRIVGNSAVTTITGYWIKKMGLQRQLYESLLTTETLKRVAIFMIAEVCSYLAYVGGEIQMAIITKDKGYEPVLMDKIEPIQAEISKLAVFKGISDWICQP